MTVMIPIMLFLTLSLAGLVVFGASAIMLAKQTGNAIDPLKAVGLSNSQRRAIDLSILLRKIPDDPADRALASARAEYVVRTDPKTLRLNISAFAGVLLALFGLYSIPAISLPIFVIQCLVLFVAVSTTLGEWRMIRFCREFVVRPRAEAN